MRIAIGLYEHFTSLDVMGPFQVLSGLPNAEVTFVAEKAGPVTDESGFLTVTARASFADLPWNFWTEHDAPLGAGFGAAIVLLKAGFGGKQENRFFRGNEHLIGKNDVLMNAQRNITKRLANMIRLGQSAQKVTTQTI